MQTARLTLVLLCAAAPTAAQTVVQTLPGDTPGAEVGRVFDVVGDIDQDGVVDVLIGYPLDDTLGQDVGRAVLLSGADGTLLWEHFGTEIDERFGAVVAGVGDANGDGVPEFAVATPFRRGGFGGGWIFSGSDFSLNISYRGLHQIDRFGTAITYVGDFDGDGFDDNAWSAPGRTTTFGSERGAVYVYSGVDGATVFELWPPDGVAGNGIEMGQLLDWVGDVDADGLDDFLIGSPAVDDAQIVHGRVCVMSGADGSVIHSVVGLNQGGSVTHQAQSLAGAGDIDGDGHADFLVASQTTGENSRVSLYSGADRSVLRVYPEAHAPGVVARVVNAGDANGDGKLDQAIAGIVPEAIVVYSGADGSVLQTIQWPVGSVDFGAHFTTAGDFDGDRHADLAIGVPLDDSAGPGHGAVVLFAGNAAGPATNYCVGATNSVGQGALMAYVGTTSLSRNDLSLLGENGPPGKFGLYFYGPNQIQTPFGDGLRCVGGQTSRLQPPVAADASGVFRKTLDLSAPPLDGGPGHVTSGSTWNFQLWYRDPMGPGGSGFNLSDGLAVPFSD